MKKYQVYGIGNALVDLEFETTDVWLSKHGITKGIMTLVDHDRQKELMNDLDIYKSKNKTCGGSAGNTIIAVSQLGGSTFYSSKVACDEIGDIFYTNLMSEGVKSNMSEKRPEGDTGRCLVFITPDGERSMNTFLGITESLSETEIREEELKNSEFLYIEGYLSSSHTGMKAAIEARKIAQDNNVKVALSLSDPAMVNFFKEGLLDMIGQKKIDLIFCNQEEAKEFIGKADVKDAAEGLKEFTHSFVITMGEKGALAYNGDESKFFEIPTNSVKPLDTNGAGDCFAGAFLYAITHGKNFYDAGKFACACSGKLVTQFGARLQKEQILSIKNEMLK